MILMFSLLRFSAIAIAVATIYLMLRDGHRQLVARLGALLLLAIVAMLFAGAPPPIDTPEPLRTIFIYISMPILVFAWWFGLSLVQDSFQLRWFHWVGLGLHEVIRVLLRFLPAGGDWNEYLQYAGQALLYVFMVHLIVAALLGLKEDLIVQRRKFRVGLAALIVFGELIGLSPVREAIGLEIIYLHVIDHSVIMAVVVWLFLMSIRFHSEVLTFTPMQEAERKEPTIEARDASLHKGLLEQVEVGQAYLEHGLTIASLADRISVPEHQLRAFINQGLGYRNFSVFLNEYRIDHAKKVLSDPESARKSVLTIAMDSGFASVSSFNRVFKDLEAITPTEFRVGALG